MLEFNWAELVRVVITVLVKDHEIIIICESFAKVGQEQKLG